MNKFRVTGTPRERTVFPNLFTGDPMELEKAIAKAKEYRIDAKQYPLAANYGDAVRFVHQGRGKTSRHIYAYELIFTFYNPDHADEAYEKTNEEKAHDNFIYHRGNVPFERTLTGDRLLLSLN